MEEKIQNQNYKPIQDNSKIMINKNIHLFLYNLLKCIFIKDYNSSHKNHLNSFLNKINKAIIKKRRKYITSEYSIDNFKNIIDFTRSQNSLFAEEIIEGLLIIIFCLTFKTDSSKSFEEYIYNNLSLIKENCGYELSEWFQERKFDPIELHNIKKLLIIEAQENNDKERNKLVIYNLLFDINKSKIIDLVQYSPNDSFSSIDLTFLDKDINENNIITTKSRIIKLILSDYYIRKFFIKIFIYYQNKNLLALEAPFIYDLENAKIKSEFASCILAPCRIEPKINQLKLTNNNLCESGISELSKVILFNKSIKIIDYDLSFVKSSYLEFLDLGIFENYSLEDLNLSFNLLKDDCEYYLIKLISCFRGLKTLNLSTNNLKGGLSSFFIKLKRLYRKGNISLENLYLIDCSLDDKSLYELGQLLKCKYCKLKKLYLNDNLVASNFLKKIKKNNSLVEIHLSGSNINNNDIDNINRIISNTGIQQIYLYKNKINNFNKLLNIIYRTKLIINDNESNDMAFDSNLINLDLSNFDILIKNARHIYLLKKIIKKTTLNCLEITNVLYDKDPDEIFYNKKSDEYNDYQKKIKELVKFLESNKSSYIQIRKNIVVNKADEERFSKIVNEESFKNLNTNADEDGKIFTKITNEELFKNFDKEIFDIKTNAKAKFPVFLKRETKKLLTNQNNKNLLKQKYNVDIDNKNVYVQLHKNLEEYITLKRAKFNLEILENMKNSEKLIII